MKLFVTLFFNCLAFALFGQLNVLNDSNPVAFELPTYSAFNGDTTLENLLQASFEQTVYQTGMTGASVALNFPNGDVWTSVIGKHTASVDINPQHAFAIGSVSKTIISATILKLTELGKISLNDTIGQWISHENIDPSITIRQCLNHTSGIYNYTNYPGVFDSIFVDDEKIYNPREAIEKYVLEPDFAKGADFNYSNTNYLIAGLIIEDVMNKPCHEAVRELVLLPNDFDEIKLFPQEMLNHEMAHLWIENEEGTAVEDFQAGGNSLNSLFSFAWTAGAYTATPSDMALWIKKLVNGDILSPQSMLEMEAFDSNGYGLGLIEAKFPEGKIIGHSGEILYSSEVYLLLPYNTSFAIHTNDGTENGDKNNLILQNLLITYLQYLATTSNNDLYNKIDLSLYPNPASQYVNVKLEMNKKDINVEIYDLQGKFISNYNYQNCNQFQIPIAQLQNGGYFLHIIGEDFRNTQFFMKNNE